MSAASPLRGRLRAIEPAAASRQTRILAALQNRRAGDLHLSALLASERDRLAAAAWIRFDTPDGPVWLAPLLVDGEMVRLTSPGPDRSPDAAAAAATLAPLEPLVAALERALGHALTPDTVAARPDMGEGDTPRRGTLIRLDAARSGSPAIHRIVLALPDDVRLAAEALPPAAAIRLRPERAAMPLRLLGPVVKASRFATIAPGDMLLLGTGPLLAQLSAQRASTRRCEIDLKRGSLTVHEGAEVRDAAQDASTGLSGSGASGSGGNGAELRVATVIEIDGGTMSADEATSLAPGSVVSLPSGAGGTLAVRVTAGGQLVGEGELVAVGQGFGVLFTSIALSPTPLAAPGSNGIGQGDQPVGSA